MKAKARRALWPFWWIVWGQVLAVLATATFVSIRDNNGYVLQFAGLTAVYVGMLVFWVWAHD